MSIARRIAMWGVVAIINLIVIGYTATDIMLNKDVSSAWLLSGASVVLGFCLGRMWSLDELMRVRSDCLERHRIVMRYVPEERLSQLAEDLEGGME